MTPTEINWTEETWNPVTGCTKVSDGCKHCYAERVFNNRLSKNPKLSDYYGRIFTDVQCHADRLKIPLHWKKPRHVFVNSMSDLFHESVPFEYVDRVFAVMALCPQHTFQVLTKRIERALKYLCAHNRSLIVANAAFDLPHGGRGSKTQRAIADGLSMALAREPGWPLPNVWLGVSVENQQAADKRIPLLLECPAAVRFLSCEPLLGEMDVEPYLPCQHCKDGNCYEHSISRQDSAYAAIDWTICGGESGPNARPMHPDWARSLRDQCAAAGVPFWFKQWGDCWNTRVVGRILDGIEHSGMPEAHHAD